MVLRAKVVGKLGVQADKVISSTLRPSGSLHRDGDHFKRKMKKTRSLSFDVETSSPMGRSESQGKSRHVLPNYMRSTTSSDARKEISTVTRLQSSPAASVDKVSRRRCSTGSPRPRVSSCSGKYSPSSAARTLKRSSSLKVVRTLIKASSFKPARSISANKCTQVVVCADSSIQKATCSSTLKETKYPEYIMLNPGGTEAEGTSIFKVCPYTYCSLNGHRHRQLPPLKRFVAARRRLLKAQKSAKVVPASPASFCRGSPADEPATRALDFETDFFVEIYAKGEKEGSLKRGGVVCISEDDGNRDSSPSEEGGCWDGMTDMGASDEHGDDGLKGDFETEIDCCSDEFSHEKEDVVPGDLDEVYSLIMIRKERMRRSLGDQYINVRSADCQEDDWDEAGYSSSEHDDGEVPSTTETEDAHDKDALENEEQKQEEEVFHVCHVGLQEGGMDCVSDGSTSSQVSDCMSIQTTDVLNEMVEDAAAAESRDFMEGHSQTGSEVPFKEIDGDDVTGAETTSTDLTLQSKADETVTGTSQGDPCSKQRDDAFDQDHLPGEAEEIDNMAEPLIYAKSVSLEGTGHQDEEETRATGQASVTELQIPDTSSEDSGEADRGISVAHGQENDESPLHIPSRLDGSGDADNHEASSTGELNLSEDPAGQSPIEDVNKAAELRTSSSVLNGTALTSSKSKGMYCRGKGKSREELSDTCMIWRINRCEKCDVPDEDPGFNPRDPNFLPIVPDPEGEKVDLRHQMIDDRRKSEEWMIDYALQRAVSKLAPARKKKVELLVAAFEKVMPDSQFEKSPTGITQGHPIQACS